LGVHVGSNPGFKVTAFPQLSVEIGGKDSPPSKRGESIILDEYADSFSEFFYRN
jgi:hypothetical protein